MMADDACWAGDIRLRASVKSQMDFSRQRHRDLIHGTEKYYIDA